MAKHKHRLMQEIPAYLIAAAVAALIWLYAEANTASTDTMTVTVAFVPNAEHLFVVQENREIRVDYKIPTGKKPELRTIDQPYRLPVTDGTSVVPLKAALGEYEPLKKLGFTIEDVQPPTITIEVLRTVSKQLPIQFMDDDMSRFKNPPQESLDPQQANVRLPESVFEQSSNLKLEVKLPDDIEYLLGMAQEEQVAISLSPELDAELPSSFVAVIDPGTTKVRFTITDKNKVIEKQASVDILIDPALWSKYRFELESVDELRRVKLSGPKDVIERINNGQTQVKLFVELTNEDVDKSKVTARIQMIPIPKVKLLSQPESVTIRIVGVPEPMVNGEVIAPPEPEKDESSP